MAHYFPARLHVLLARDAPVSVVIRRGPSKRVATFLWDRRTDEFQLGQWFRGRIYERRCDLSPDGKYLLYFAMNGLWNEESEGAFSAISRAPYLKAIAMFPKGDGWYGGGLWTSNTTYWLNEAGEPPVLHKVLHDTTEVTRDREFEPPERFNRQCLGVYYPRLLRDGWSLIERIRVSDDGEDWERKDVFEKQCPQGWVLRKVAHSALKHPEGTGHFWDEHALVHPQSRCSQVCLGWEWAEVDGDRLVWAEGGCMKSADITSDGLDQPKVLQDFNDITPKRTKAPY